MLSVLYRYALFLLTLLLPFSAAYAEDSFVGQCGLPTPSTGEEHYPGHGNIILSNDLARPAGKVNYASGQLLYVSGKLTDENCVPIVGAAIDLWQANPFGEYRWASRDELLNPEPVFAGNGRAVTDNLGRFNFITLFPGSIGKQAPHLQFRVVHPDFKLLNTSMYFKGDRRNSADPRFKAFKGDAQNHLLGKVDVDSQQEIIQVNYDITLKGRSPYRSY